MRNNTVIVTEEALIVEPVGLDKLWSFTRRLTFPLTHVRGATFDPGMKDEPKGWRAPGLRVAGKLSGTFHTEGKKQFWNISGYDRAVVITLDPAETFNRLVITVADPHAVVDLINRAIGTHKPH